MTGTFSLSFDLRKYFDEYVVIDKDDRKAALEVVLPIVQKLAETVSKNSNDIFGRQLVNVGSYYQGLKTQQTNEFDHSVPLRGLDDIVWGNIEPTISYGFDGIDDEKTARTTSRQGLKIVQKSSRMSPSFNTGRVQLGREKLTKYEIMSYNGDLVPYLVKMTFKNLLSFACSEMRGVTMCQQAHGPALMVTISKEYSRLQHDVNIDFAPVIQSQLKHREEWGWPCLATRNWLSAEEIQTITSKGVGLVAKENFFWTYSFAVMEKEISRHADKANECRKKVHRIMKVIFKNQWRQGSGISTYELKNAWLLYCESEADQNWDEKDYLGSRFVGCTLFFYDKLMKRNLPQYFRRENNLLAGKKPDDIEMTAANIRAFLLKYKFVENASHDLCIVFYGNGSWTIQRIISR